MPKKDEATTEEVDTSTEDNELEAYFDNPDADVEVGEPTEEESETEKVESSEEEETSKEEESESEEDTTAETEEEESQEGTSDETDAEESTEEDTNSEEPKQEEEKPKKGEPDPEMAKEAFKRREAERKLREEQQKREQENLQRYLDEAQDDEVELEKRQIEVNKYLLTKERSNVLQDKLQVSMEKAVQDLGLKKMDEATSNFIARRLDDFEATRVIKDQNGNIVEVKGDVYQYLKEEMDSIQAFRSIGAREQTKKKAKEKVAVIPKPTRTPKEKPVDEDMDAFDEEANKW